MNIVTRQKPEASVSADKVEPSVPLISAEERARRQAAVDYARGSVRLEGFVVSSFAEELNRRYVDGAITRKELTAALLAHYTP